MIVPFSLKLGDVHSLYITSKGHKWTGNYILTATCVRIYTHSRGFAKTAEASTRSSSKENARPFMTIFFCLTEFGGCFAAARSAIYIDYCIAESARAHIRS